MERFHYLSALFSGLPAVSSSSSESIDSTTPAMFTASSSYFEERAGKRETEQGRGGENDGHREHLRQPR